MLHQLTHVETMIKIPIQELKPMKYSYETKVQYLTHANRSQLCMHNGKNIQTKGFPDIS